MQPLSHMWSAGHAVTMRQRAIVLAILQRDVDDASSARPENVTRINPPRHRRGPQYLAPLPERVRAHDRGEGLHPLLFPGGDDEREGARRLRLVQHLGGHVAARESRTQAEQRAEPGILAAQLGEEGGREGGGVALGDHERVLQIGRALVDNALLHTPAGTPVRIVARGADLRVEDDGPGIPADQHEQVFARFSRLDGSRASGTGLGLAIARELAVRMGGSVELESRPGRTVFTLRLAAFSRENEPLATVR